MSELIEKQAVIDALLARMDTIDDKPEVVLGLAVAAGMIKDMPSVTPAEKVGHWIAIDEEPHEDYECDKCGYTISTYTVNIEPHTEYKYCPNCGARMRASSAGAEGSEG